MTSEWDAESNIVPRYFRLRMCEFSYLVFGLKAVRGTGGRRGADAGRQDPEEHTIRSMLRQALDATKK